MQTFRNRKLPLLWHQKRMVVISLTLFLLAFATCFNWAGWQSINIAKAETIESITQYADQIEHPTEKSSGVSVLDLLHDSISGASSLSFAVLEFLCTSVYTSNSPFLIPRICTHLSSHARGLLNENGEPVPVQAPPEEEPLDVVRNWLEMISNFGQLITLVVLATVGFVCGTIAEKKHYASIKRRELKFRELPAVPIRLHHFLSAQQQEAVVETRLVTGCVVVSQDYFKMILANLKNFVGGSVSSYESLMDRARREAILRMKEQAPMADAIVNVRLESVTMGKEEGDKKPICSIQVLAYGTAVTLQR